MQCSEWYHKTFSTKWCRMCGKDLHAKCPDCKSWPQDWQKMIDAGQLIPGAHYKNVVNEHVGPHRNLRTPKGHLIGAVAVGSGIEMYFGIKTSDKHWARMTSMEVVKLYLMMWYLSLLRLLRKN